MPKQLELLSGKQISKIPESQNWLSRNIGRQAYNLAEGIVNLGQYARNTQNLTQQALAGTQTPEQLVQQQQEFRPQPLVKEALGLSNQQTRPQNIGEEFLDVLGGDLPAAYALGGGNLLRRLGLGALGSAGRFGAEKVGFGPIGQTIVGTGLPLAVSAFGPQKGAQHKETLKQKDITKAVEDYREHAYEKAQNIADKSKSKVIATPLQKFINQEEKNAQRVKSDVNKKIIEDISDFEHHINEGKINVRDLWERKKFYNAELAKKPDSKLAGYYSRARDKTLEELNKFGKENPQFGEPFTAGEQSHKALKRAEEAREFIKRNVNLEKFIKHPLSTTILFGIGKGKEVIPGYASLLWNSPKAQEYAFKAIKGAFDENIPAFINNATKLDKIVGEYESKTKGKKQLELLSGRLANS